MKSGLRRFTVPLLPGPHDGGLLKPARFMQIDAPVTGGSSGGVVFNARGEAVGMVSYGNRFTQTVPIGRVLAVADALRRGRHYE